MKKIYLITALTISTCIGFAQTRIHGSVTHVLNPLSNASKTIAPALMTNGCDTIWNILPTDTGALYGAGPGQWGYVSGTNSYGDIGKAEKFLSTSYTAGYNLIACGIFFAKAVDGSSPTTMYVNVWSDSSANIPGHLLTTPVALPISSMATGGPATPVSFTLSTGLTNMTGNFYIGVDGFVYDAPSAQEDTVAIYQSTNLPTHVALAYDEFGGGGWALESAPSNWANSSDFYIYVILCDPTLGDVQIMNPTPEVIVFPNPSTGNVFVSTGSATAENVNVTVVDALGKTVFASGQYLQKGGTYKVEMNGVAAGVYFMTVTTAGKSVTKKLIVE